MSVPDAGVLGPAPSEARRGGGSLHQTSRGLACGAVGRERPGGEGAPRTAQGARTRFAPALCPLSGHAEAQT